MTNAMQEAFAQAGLNSLADANSGQALGVSRTISTWHEDKRQAAGTAYDMSKVHVITETLVQKVILTRTESTYAVTGVLTSDGKVYRARKEVIVSCGAFRTPQILMLSGIGERAELQTLGIEQVIDSPQVGKNLHDRKLFSNVPLVLPVSTAWLAMA
jgi:choline dehydrogenase-like flavoprotein